MNDQVRPIAPDTTNPGGDGIEVGSEEARGGSTSRVTRTMLGWGRKSTAAPAPAPEPTAAEPKKRSIRKLKLS
jgi:hypothetical protein